MSNNSLLQSYSANVIINCFRKMLLLKMIFDKRWPIAASNWTCQSQIMYANGLNSWNCRGFSGKSMSFEKQVKSFFHAFFFFLFSGKRLSPSDLEKFFFQKKEKPANKHWECIDPKKLNFNTFLICVLVLTSGWDYIGIFYSSTIIRFWTSEHATMLVKYTKYNFCVFC